MSRMIVISLVLVALVALPSCRTNANRSPSTSIVGGTAAGAGLGALVGWAAGKPGTGAAVGAGVGLLAGAIQADADARERDRQDEIRARRTVIVREEADRDRVYRSERDERRDRAYDYLYEAQRSSDPVRAERLLKLSLTEYRTPEAHTALGELYESQGDGAAAESEYRRALDLDPEYRPAEDDLRRLGRR